MLMLELTLAIGGKAVIIHSPEDGFLKGLEEKYSNFIAKPQLNSFVRVCVDHAFEPDNRDDIKVEESANIYDIRCGDFAAIIDINRELVNVKMRAYKEAFDVFLRILYSVLLLKEDGFLLHSTGLARDNRGFVFCGRSSSGKSTTAKMAEGFQILSDELVIIKKKQKGFQLFLTPFSGESKPQSTRTQVPLEKIFFLTKDTDVSCRRLEKLGVFIKLMENVFFFARDKVSNQRIIDLCRELSFSVAGFEVNILKQESVGRLINGFSKDNAAQ